MTRDFRSRFVRDGEAVPQGAQGLSYGATDSDTGERVFVKELANQTSEPARRRFRREVVAYETVAADGLPRLISDNSAEWQSMTVPLFMVLEWIDGSNLRDKVESDGPLSLHDAADCINSVGKSLAACHAEEVYHRDIKPANVMLRGGNVIDPVLVDFGLSFNSADVGDVTGDERIGNGFLRLPEHAPEGRSRGPLGDVTQLAGLLFYCVTAITPRLLVDEDGRTPHQRSDAKSVLADRVPDRQGLRLNALFDTAFQTQMGRRFPSVDALLEALDKVLQRGSEVGADDVEVMFQNVIQDLGHRTAAEAHARLQAFWLGAYEAVRRLAAASGLQFDQSGTTEQPAGATPYAEVRLRLYPHSVDPTKTLVPWVTYRFEIEADDVIFKIDGEDQWRGTLSDEPALVSSIESAAKRALAQAFTR